MDDIRRDYDGLRRHGVQVVNDEVTAIDAAKKLVRLERGGDLSYDRLVVSPGVDFTFAEIQDYEPAMKAGKVLHAWKAGSQTEDLRRQLEQMRDGGVFLLSIPPAPYRCPPGPYERASVVADYFKRAKPRAKVLVLDANPDITSKAPLFKAAWKDLYGGLIEYRGNTRAVGIDAATMTVKCEVEDVRGDVLNVIPPQGAGDIARKGGLITTNNRWCDVDWRTMESKAAPGIHVLGDATLSGPAMPKSASMANNHAKIAAAAIVEILAGRTPAPFRSSTPATASCRKWRPSAFLRARLGRQGPHVEAVPGSGGVSAARSEAEGSYAWSWARNIWADSLA